MNFYDFIGILGTVIMMYSNIPQIHMFIKQQHARGISIAAMWTWLIASILRCVYMMHLIGFNMIALFSYFFAIVCALITLYYCYFPKGPDAIL